VSDKTEGSRKVTGACLRDLIRKITAREGIEACGQEKVENGHSIEA